MVPPSCFVDRQRTTLHTSRNKRRFMSNKTWKNAHSCDRLTSEVSSHQMTSFLASKMSGKGHWDSACQIHIRTRARRKSKLTTGGCGALRRCGCAWTNKGTQFHCVKFRLGSAGEPTICSHCYDVLNEDRQILTSGVMKKKTETPFNTKGGVHHTRLCYRRIKSQPDRITQ